MEVLVCPPGLQILPLEAFEIKVALPPWQKLIGPFGEITGVAGVGLTTTVTVLEDAETQPFCVAVTAKVPEVVTTMEAVVSPPGIHVLPEGALEIKVTEPPSQKVVGPAFEMLGVAGVGLALTDKLCGTEVPHPFTVLTSMFPPVAPVVTEMEVPVLLPVHPEGRVQT